ncbi:hypothetical protein [Streptomyces sp. NPDC017940]|uniref:hypothetical protein n=1 Tax=Streptomyces sp. NPDC017940 TaxID=3365017 RepID=UPI0037886C01
MLALESRTHPTRYQLARALADMIAPDIAIRDVLIGYKTRPRVASRFNHRGGGSIHHYLTTLHTRLYGSSADPGPLPTDLDELRLTALTGADGHQRAALLAHLATQLPHTANYLNRAGDFPHLPGYTRAWLHDAATALRHLAIRVSHLSPTSALPVAGTAAETSIPPAVADGADPTPEDITRVLADFISPQIAPDDVLLDFTPHLRTSGRITARTAPAPVFGALLHARLHGLEAASAPPQPWHELGRASHATDDQQQAALLWLSGQLHSAGDILAWARDWSHWRQMPPGIHAQLASATTTVHELADGIGRAPADLRTTPAAAPVPARPVAPSATPARR